MVLNYRHNYSNSPQIDSVQHVKMDNIHLAVWLSLGICLVIIIVFGVSGNVLSLLVWTKGNRCSNRRGAIYLRLLALSDILVLTFPAVELTVALLKPAFILRNLNAVFCKIFPICPFFCVQLSTWIVVCLTLEQTIAVCRPFRAMASASQLRQYGIVLFVAVISFLDNLPHFLASSWDIQGLAVSYDNTSNADRNFSSREPENFDISCENCTQRFAPSEVKDSFNGDLNFSSRNPEIFDVCENCTQRVNSDFHKTSYTCVNTFSADWNVYVVQLGIISVLPVLILMTCNLIILTKILRQNKKLTTTESRHSGQGKKDTLVTVMITRTIAISIVQCVTTIPLMSWNIYILFHGSDNSTVVGFYVCNAIYYLNNAVNVVFYCLLGQSFRQDCVDIFFGIFQRRQTVAETTTSSRI